MCARSLFHTAVNVCVFLIACVVPQLNDEVLLFFCGLEKADKKQYEALRARFPDISALLLRIDGLAI